MDVCTSVKGLFTLLNRVMVNRGAHGALLFAERRCVRTSARCLTPTTRGASSSVLSSRNEYKLVTGWNRKIGNSDFMPGSKLKVRNKVRNKFASSKKLCMVEAGKRGRSRPHNSGCMLVPTTISMWTSEIVRIDPLGAVVARKHEI